MEVADKGLRIPESVYGFTLPLGATINMNGLASTLGVISVFAANLYNNYIIYKVKVVLFNIFSFT